MLGHPFNPAQHPRSHGEFVPKGTPQVGGSAGQAERTQSGIAQPGAGGTSAVAIPTHDRPESPQSPFYDKTKAGDTSPTSPQQSQTLADHGWRTIRGARARVHEGRIAEGPAYMVGRSPRMFGHSGMPDGTEPEHEEPKATPSAAPVNPEHEAAARLWREQGHRSPHFKSFFGDWENEPHASSKVVHSQTGEPHEQEPIYGDRPAIVYHGTPHHGWSKFDKKFILDPEQQKYGAGFYFTESRSHAQGYAGKKGQVKEVYLNIRNPFDIDRHAIPTHLLPHETQQGLLAERKGRPLPKAVSWHVAKGHAKNADLTAAIQNMGHDGLTSNYSSVVPPSTTGGKMQVGKHRVWIAFEPKQIKAKDNRGTFDPNEEDSMFSASIGVQWLRSRMFRDTPALEWLGAKIRNNHHV